MSYRQIISSRLYLGLKGIFSLASEALLNTDEQTKERKCYLKIPIKALRAAKNALAGHMLSKCLRPLQQSNGAYFQTSHPGLYFRQHPVRLLILKQTFQQFCYQ